MLENVPKNPRFLKICALFRHFLDILAEVVSNSPKIPDPPRRATRPHSVANARGMFYPSRTRTAPHKARHSRENAPPRASLPRSFLKVGTPDPDDVRPATRPRAVSNLPHPCPAPSPCPPPVLPPPVPPRACHGWGKRAASPPPSPAPHIIHSPAPPEHLPAPAHPCPLCCTLCTPSRAPSCAVCVHDNASGRASL